MRGLGPRRSDGNTSHGKYYECMPRAAGGDAGQHCSPSQTDILFPPTSLTLSLHVSGFFVHTRHTALGVGLVVVAACARLSMSSPFEVQDLLLLSLSSFSQMPCSALHQSGGIALLYSLAHIFLRYLVVLYVSSGDVQYSARALFLFTCPCIFNLFGPLVVCSCILTPLLPCGAFQESRPGDVEH